MKSALIALLAFCLCMPLMGDDATKKFFEETKAKAEMGTPIAQYYLGIMYANGRGVLKDQKEAVKWYRKAAEQGFAEAQSSLFGMYTKGNGVQQDIVIAFAWLIISATNGEQFAKKKIGIVAKEMTFEQTTKAQELSKEMVKKNPKLINK